MTIGANVARLIQDLSEANAGKRAAAASALYQRGCELAESVTQGWLAHARLAKLLDFQGTCKITAGIAVEPGTFEQIRAVNESPRLADVPPDQDAREFELDFPGGVRLDILTTRRPGEEGAIARYLQRFGEGIQQVELEVSDVDLATEILREEFALEPIYRETRAGADGTRVNFFLVPASDGKKVLIELVEAA